MDMSLISVLWHIVVTLLVTVALSIKLHNLVKGNITLISPFDVMVAIAVSAFIYTVAEKVSVIWILSYGMLIFPNYVDYYVNRQCIERVTPELRDRICREMGHYTNGYTMIFITTYILTRAFNGYEIIPT